MGTYYKKSDIVEKQFYRPPSWISLNFDDIEGREFEIQEGDRLDVIAEQVYGDPNLWKAIALYNKFNFFAFENKNGMVQMKMQINNTAKK